MNKIRSVIARLEAFFAKENWSNSPSFQRLLGDYNQVCEELNQRLGKCEALLSAGKRAEALLSAETCPSLFEVVPPLQGPGILKFFEACNSYQLPPPRVLKTSVFQSLLEVQNEPTTLQEWIGVFRSMSRSKASEEKLIVLRKIVEWQPNDPDWLNQLHHTEVAFIPGLIEEAKQDIQNGNWEALEAKEEMLSSPSWRASVPDVVMEKIHRTLEEARSREFGAKAQEILQQAEASLAADSFPDFLQIADHWQLLCELDRYLPSEEESLRFARVEEHFAEQRAELMEEQSYNNAVSRLRLFMETPAEHPYEKVMELYSALAELGRPIPEDILAYIRHEGSKRRLQKVKSTFLNILLVGILGVGCVGGGLFWHEKGKRIQQLAMAVEKKDVGRGQEMKQKLDASWWRLLKKDKQKIRALEEELSELAQEEKEFLQELEEWRSTYLVAERVEEGETGEEELQDMVDSAETVASIQRAQEVQGEAKEYRENLRRENTQEMEKTLAALRSLEEQFDACARTFSWEAMNEILMEVEILQEKARSITYYDEACVSDEDRERWELMGWKIRKHLAQYKAIADKLKEVGQQMADREALVEQQWPDLFGELSSWMEEYCQDEEEEENLAWECRKRQAGMVDASILKEKMDALKTSYGGKKRAWEIGQWLLALENAYGRFREEVDKGNWEAARQALAEYAMPYKPLKEQGRRRGASQEEKEAWARFDKLRSPDALEKEWEEKKNLAEFMLSFQNGLSTLSSPEVRRSFLHTLEKRKKEFGEAGRKLAYQLESLGVLMDWREGRLKMSLPPSENSVGCFQDLWRYKNWKPQAEALFEQAKQGVLSLQSRYLSQANGIGYFCFQDAQGGLHEWIYGKGELFFANANVSSRKERLRFGFGNWEFTAMDDYLEVTQLKTSGRKVTQHYSRCAFPKRLKKSDGTVEWTARERKYIAGKELEETGIPLDPRKTVEKLQNMEKTFLSLGYGELLLDQQSPPCVWMDLRCHYAEKLLAPWYAVAQHGKRSKVGQEKRANPMASVFALPELEREWQQVKELWEALDQLVGFLDSSSYGDKVSLGDDLVKERFLALNFSPLKSISGSLNAYLSLQEKLANCTFSCVGLAWGQGTQLTLNPQVKDSDGEVWALLPPPQGTRRVGVLRKGKVVLEANFWDAYGEDAVLLVTPGPQVDSRQWAKEYQEELSALGGTVPCLPSLFPVNAEAR